MLFILRIIMDGRRFLGDSFKDALLIYGGSILFSIFLIGVIFGVFYFGKGMALMDAIQIALLANALGSIGLLFKLMQIMSPSDINYNLSPVVVKRNDMVIKVGLFITDICLCGALIIAFLRAGHF